MEKPLVAVPATRGPKQHFFGYYTKRQFDASDRYTLGLECDVIGRLQRADDKAVVGIVDIKDGNRWIPLAETRAWNWQMGCMAEWLPGADNRIIYNDRRDGHFVSVIRDIERGERRVLPVPIFEISPDGRSALTLNFSRLWDVRPETGYCGVKDSWHSLCAPDEDGVFRVDLETGKSALIVSHADMAGLPPVNKTPPDSKRYFTHLLFNEDGSRFMFWYRAFKEGCPSFHSAVYTASPDGKDIHLVNDANSHTVWLGRDKILAWAKHKDKGQHTYLFIDQTDEFQIMGAGLLEFNGHAAFSPNRKWLLSDIAPDEKGERTLVLYNCAANRRVEIGRFHSMPELAKDLRCDLHPRWNRSGSQVCIDSTHEGSRQMYLLDVREIISDSIYERL